MDPYTHKASVLSKSSRRETTCIDGTEAVFAPLLGAFCRNASNAIPSPPTRS
jgi:hypothetical protein